MSAPALLLVMTTGGPGITICSSRSLACYLFSTVRSLVPLTKRRSRVRRDVGLILYLIYVPGKSIEFNRKLGHVTQMAVRELMIKLKKAEM